MEEEVKQFAILEARDFFLKCRCDRRIMLDDREIGRSAFEWCDELAYVSLPKSVTTLKRHAFDNCPRLVLSIPHDLKDTEFDEYDTLPLSVIVRDR